MPWSVCKKLNIQPEKIDAKITQLDRSQVPTVGELNNVIIRLSFDSWVHQCIDIIVVEILEAYGLLLSTDWSCKLQGYFATDWSHLWLPYKGKNNQIRVKNKPCMKHTVSDLKGSNEPISYAQEELRVCFLETLLGCYQSQTSTIPMSTQLELPSHPPTNENEIYVLNLNTLDPFILNDGIWMLYYDKSKTHDGARAGCVLVDPNRLF